MRMRSSRRHVPDRSATSSDCTRLDARRHARARRIGRTTSSCSGKRLGSRRGRSLRSSSVVMNDGSCPNGSRASRLADVSDRVALERTRCISRRAAGSGSVARSCSVPHAWCSCESTPAANSRACSSHQCTLLTWRVCSCSSVVCVVTWMLLVIRRASSAARFASTVAIRLASSAARRASSAARFASTVAILLASSAACRASSVACRGMAPRRMVLAEVHASAWETRAAKIRRRGRAAAIGFAGRPVFRRRD